ncbi:MAG: hypothetical protein OEW42_03560 [Acidimicrobiia bacterium]|nr:hypothetical protein [Acidimicrobiia bacterium]MDH5236746.1 hypothetical protein [Acidimicrobiia bacterium]
MIDRSSPLTVDSFSLAIGEESIGLPPARSFDTLLSHYLELVGRLRDTDRGDLRADDIEELSRATGVDKRVIENRLRSLVSA